MLVLGIVLAIARGIYLNSVPSTVLPSDAAAVLYDTLVRFIKDGLRILLVVGLIVAIAAFFTGPSVTAVRTRQGLSKGLGWLRSSGERAGLRTGPVGSWTYQHRTALRISAVALFAIIFVFLATPSAASAIILAILLLVVLGLIELIGRPPAQAQPAQATGTAAASSMLAQAAGLAVLAAISPTALLVAAVYLGSARPRQTLLFYLIGALLMSTVMGAVVLVLLRSGGFSLPHHRTPRYGLRLGLGILLAARRADAGPPQAEAARPGQAAEGADRPADRQPGPVHRASWLAS